MEIEVVISIESDARHISKRNIRISQIDFHPFLRPV